MLNIIWLREEIICHIKGGVDYMMFSIENFNFISRFLSYEEIYSTFI